MPPPTLNSEEPENRVDMIAPFLQLGSKGCEELRCFIVGVFGCLCGGM